MQKTILEKVYGEKGEGEEIGLPPEALTRASWDILGYCYKNALTMIIKETQMCVWKKTWEIFSFKTVNKGFKSLFSGYFPANKKLTTSISVSDW